MFPRFSSHVRVQKPAPCATPALCAAVVPSAAIAALLLVIVPVASAAEELRQLPGGRLLTGIAAPASRLAPSLVAERFLASRAAELGIPDPTALRPLAVLPLAAGGVVVRLGQTHLGLEVVGGGASVRVDALGRVRRVHAHAAPTSAVTSAIPRLPASQALRLLSTRYASHRAESAVDDRFLRLVVLALPTGGRLAYQFAPPPSTFYREALRLYLDADSGALLWRVNDVRTLNQAKVFEFNPVSTPKLETVTLSGLRPGQKVLLGELIDTRNCIDLHEMTKVSFEGQTLEVHTCSEVARATADASGDFLYQRPAQDTAPEDEFAEVQMYFHVSQAYAFFQGLGFSLLPDKPLRTVSNFRIPVDITDPGMNISEAFDPSGPLYPLDNAMFMPAGALYGIIDRPFGSIIFGQGKTVDYSYDGDVVFHEFTHAVIGATANLGAGLLLDSQGLDGSPLAMNEGYADLFSAAIAGDPRLGEYAGGGPAGSSVRNLENSDRCPDSFWGESHQDSQAFSAALWGLRKQLATPEVDKRLYAAMASLGPMANFDAAVAATLDELKALGDAAVSVARSQFEAHNLIKCLRVIQYSEPRSLMIVEGTATTGLYPIVPGYLQFRYQAQQPVPGFAVWFGLESMLDSLLGFLGGPPDFRLLVKQGDSPLAFTYQGGVRSNADFEIPIREVKPGNYLGSYGQALPAGTYHMMVVNAGQTGGAIVRLTLGEQPPLPGDGSGKRDGGGVKDVAAPADRGSVPDGGPAIDSAAAGDAGSDDGGGGCSLAGAGARAHGGAAAGWVLLVGCAGLALAARSRVGARSRRRTSNTRPPAASLPPSAEPAVPPLG